MSNPLTRSQIDGEQCAVPGCTHEDHSVLFLNQRCHTGAGATVSYDKRTGLLTVRCKECNELVADVQVAP